MWTIPATRMKTSREHRGTAVRSRRRGPACGSSAAQELDYGPARRAGLSQRARQAARRRQAVEAARAVGDPGRSAWLPVLVPGLGVREDQSPARGGRGRARARRSQPDRSGVCEERPVRPSAAAHDRLDAIPRPETLTSAYRCVTSGGRIRTRCSSAVTMAPCASSAP